MRLDGVTRRLGAWGFSYVMYLLVSDGTIVLQKIEIRRIGGSG